MQAACHGTRMEAASIGAHAGCARACMQATSARMQAVDLGF
jgi:hypothetical protein